MPSFRPTPTVANNRGSRKIHPSVAPTIVGRLRNNLEITSIVCSLLMRSERNKQPTRDSLLCYDPSLFKIWFLPKRRWKSTVAAFQRIGHGRRPVNDVGLVEPMIVCQPGGIRPLARMEGLPDGVTADVCTRQWIQSSLRCSIKRNGARRCWRRWWICLLLLLLEPGPSRQRRQGFICV